MTTLTDASAANKSGKSMEEQLELVLNTKDIPYRRQKSGASQIDFIIQIGDKVIYADCTNQNIGGSVEEKIPHKVWKYWKKYNYNEVYIIRGDYTIGKTVMEHLQDEEKTRGYKTHIVTFEEFVSLVTNTPTKKTNLEEFM
jgi:hypothetical protein